MHDFEFIAIAELCRCPTVSRNKVTIELNGNAVGLHAEFRKKIRHAGNCTKFAIFAIDN